jgi:flagellar biosynthesis/type III secretory pathway chaperone
MTDLSTPLIEAAIEAGCEQARELHRLLEAEFAALGEQDLPAFERIQRAKEEALRQLSALVTTLAGREAAGETLDEGQARAWGDFRSLIGTCRESHRRNDILIRNRLVGIQAALQVLGQSDGAEAVAVYDRLGRVRRTPGLRAYSEA